MRSHLIRWAVLVWAGVWLATAVEAQTTTNGSNRGSLIDQLDQFGRSLFGGKRPAPNTQRQMPQAANSRAGSTLQAGQGTTRPAPANAGMAIETGTSVRMHQSTALSTSPSPTAAAAAPTDQSCPTTAPATAPSPITATSPSTVYAANPTGSTSLTATSTGSSGSSTSGSPASMRLHERLSQFRQSNFDAQNGTPSSGTTASASAVSQPAATTPSVKISSAPSGSSMGLRQPTSGTQAIINPAVSQPAIAQPAYSQRYSRPAWSSSSEAPGSAAATMAKSSSTPTLAPRHEEKSALTPSASLSRGGKYQPTLAPTKSQFSPRPSASTFAGNDLDEVSEPEFSEDSLSLEPEPEAELQTEPEEEEEVVAAPDDAESLPTAVKSKAKGVKPMAIEDVADALFTRQSPVLNVKTLGPRRIAVGKESTYQLVMQNSGTVGADEVVVTVGLPDWAEVVGVQATNGETGAANEFQASKQLTWKIAHLAASAKEKLTLRLIPRQSRPFDLAVRWDYKPVASEAMIEVQEPKLEMRLDGPREVLFGKREVYRLELANTGSGEAEAVEISLLPIGTGENMPATHRLGNLEAGEKKIIEVELTARQAGVLTIKVDARGDGGVAASLAETIAVLRAALQVSVDAPKMQFVGNDVRYQIHVTNTGTAPATNLQLAARLPLGTKYVSSTGDGKLVAERNDLSWFVDALPPGGTKDITVVCSLERPGTNRLDVSAMADGELAASAASTMQVEAMADLRLDVVDPTGPVAVGEEACYEITIHNRGSKSAENVEVMAYFSRGVEPVSVEGGSHKIAPGQVAFDRLPVVAAGQSVTFKIHARAETAGNHVFRAEVFCKPLGAKLASEETTHYYGGLENAGSRTLQANDPSVSSEPIDRTADRRQSDIPSSPTGKSQSIGNGGAGRAPALLNGRSRPSFGPIK